MAKFLQLVDGIPTMVEQAAASIYQATYTVSGTLTSGTAVTLPSSGSYTDVDLKVYVDGKRQYVTHDFNYVGSGTRTQVSFTTDLSNGSIILFEKDS